AGDRLRGRALGPEGAAHGPRRRDHPRRRRERGGEGGDHEGGVDHRGAQPGGARGDGGQGARLPHPARGGGDLMARPVVVVTRRLPAAVEEALAREFEVRLNPEDRPLGASELQEALRCADALLPTVTDRLTAEVLGVEPLRARMIANFGVGFNHIDVEAAKRRGIAVSNTPDVLTDATADLAMTLLL